MHRLRDLTEPEHIHQLLHPDLASEFPKLRSLEGPGDSLPSQLTTFVGRRHEIAEVESLLREYRLVTLSGSGGAGKTRLALQVAGGIVSEFPHGIRFLELAALVDDDLFVNEVAERFGATPVPGVPLITAIAETVGDKRMLLILDNCEQIIGPVASLSRELLLACPNLHIVATSRERLALAGEAVYRVPSLSLPTTDVGASTALEFDAIRLFVDRARLADLEFELEADSVADVVSICRRLDGIPLALELAAARVRSMSPAQISARLDERFRILTDSERSGSQRQQTLLRTIEWSHDLLDERDRVVFRRLGVFVSDFSLEAAEQVASADRIFEFDVSELLTSLVDKSMVTTEKSSSAGIRYRLLESIRVFARVKLDEASEQRGREPAPRRVLRGSRRVAPGDVPRRRSRRRAGRSRARRTTSVHSSGSRWIPNCGSRPREWSALSGTSGTGRERIAKGCNGARPSSRPTRSCPTSFVPGHSTAMR